MRTVDFGGELRTRAVRIRAVLAAGVLGVQGFKSPVVGKQEAGFDSALAYTASGEDAPALMPELMLPGNFHMTDQSFGDLEEWWFHASD